MIYRHIAAHLSSVGLAIALANPTALAFPLPQEGGDEIADALRKLETEADSVWEYMTNVYDADHDGAITFTEYARTKEAFERLDVDKSGTLTREDFARGGAQGGGGRRGGGRRGGAGRGERGGRGGGEARSGREGRRSARARSPKVGAPAPDFELVVLEEPAAPPESGAAPAAGGEREEPAPPAPPAAGEKGEQGKKGKKDQEGEDGKKEDPEKIRLSSFKGKRAVALIFGSYT